MILFRMSILLSVLLQLWQTSFVSAKEWKYIGPDGGEVFRLVPDRKHPLLWYSYVEQQLYVSRDGAKSWNKIRLPFADDLPRFEINSGIGARSILVHPSTSRVLVTDYRDNTLALWESKNLGKTFQFKTLLALSRIYVPHLVQDPTNENILYSFAADSGLLKSHDGGLSWHPLPPIPVPIKPEAGCSLDKAEFNDFVVSSWNSQEIYGSGGVVEYCYRDEHFYPFLWRSADGGQTWKVLEEKSYYFEFDPLFPDRVIAYRPGVRVITSKGMGPLLTTEFGFFGGLITLADSPENLLAQIYNDEEGWGIYYSGDLGRTWKRTLLGSNSRIFEVGLMKSVDDHAGGILMGNDQGLFYRNRSKLWTQLSKGLQEANALEVLTDKQGSIYALIKPEGGYVLQFYRTADSGKSWTDVLPPLKFGPVVSVIVDPKSNDLLAFTFPGKIIKSTNNGESWFLQGKVPRFPGFTAIAIDPNYPQWVYVAEEGCLYRSQNGAADSKRLWCISDSILQIVVDPFESKNVYLVTERSGILKSTNRGLTYSLTSTDTRRFGAIVPLGLRDAYIAYQGRQNGTLKTLDGGKSWQKVNAPSDVIKILPADSQGEHLFALTQTALFESPNSGKNWKNITGPKFQDLYLQDFTDPSNRPIYIGTKDGIWKEILN